MSDWRIEALAELIDIAHSVSGEKDFSRADFLNRLTISADALAHTLPADRPEQDYTLITAIAAFGLKVAAERLSEQDGLAIADQLDELRRTGWQRINDATPEQINTVLEEALRYNRHFERQAPNPRREKEPCENLTEF